MDSCCPVSQKLLKHIQKWKSKPVMDDELSGAIDSFVNQQSETEEILPNGLSTYNFAEAALFVQNWATLYDKKVDLLLKQFIKLHLMLCDVSSKPPEENTNEPVPSTSTANLEVVNPAQSTDKPEENPKQKNKRKKNDKKEETNEPGTSAQDPTLGEESSAEQQPKENPYSEKELQEIGVLWNMLDNCEKKQIKKILNKIDGEEDDSISDSEDTTPPLEACPDNTATENNTSEETSQNTKNTSEATDNQNDSFNQPSTSNSETTSSVDISNTQSEPVSENTIDETINTVNESINTVDESINTVDESINTVNESINTVDETVNVDARVHCIREARLRLECLSDEVLQKYGIDSRSLRKKKIDEHRNEYLDFKGFPKSCGENDSCKGCKAIKEYLKIEKSKLQKSIRMGKKLSGKTELEKTSRKIEVKEKFYKKIKLKECVVLLSKQNVLCNRKRTLHNETDSAIDLKKRKLPDPISVPSKEFDAFYDSCYPNLSWNDGDLQCLDAENIYNKIISENRPVKNKLIEQPKEPGGKEIGNEDVDMIQEPIDNNDTTEPEPTCSSENHENINESRNDEELPTYTVQIDKDTTINITIDTTNLELMELNQTFEFPHTPATSDDSGRFSASAYHSDYDGESHNRVVHHDSGVEMSHHSDEEDEGVSVVEPPENPFTDMEPLDNLFKDMEPPENLFKDMEPPENLFKDMEPPENPLKDMDTPENPFKDMDPNSIRFYKEKCENLLEKRERDKKVKEWETFLKEKEKTELPEFDIRQYENKILDVLPEDRTTDVTFGQLVTGKSSAEIARYFCACLQLANMGNIDLYDVHNAEVTEDGLRLSLQTKHKYYEELNCSVPTEMDFIRHMNNRDPNLQSTPSTSRKHFSRRL